MASSPPAFDLPLAAASEGESRLATVVYDMSNQVQVAMESMLGKIGEIDQHSAKVMEEIERSKTSVLERKRVIEEEKERVQKAAFTVLNLFNGLDTN